MQAINVPDSLAQVSKNGVKLKFLEAFWGKVEPVQTESDLHSPEKASHSSATGISALETGPGPIFSVGTASFCTISFQTNGFPFREVISAQPRVGRAGFLP